jgi:hypothetical protein
MVQAASLLVSLGGMGCCWVSLTLLLLWVFSLLFHYLYQFTLLVKEWDFEASGVIWSTLSLHHQRQLYLCLHGAVDYQRQQIFISYLHDML